MSKLATESAAHYIVPTSGARPSILFIVDVPNWAHDFKTRNLIRVLGQDYDLRQFYQAEVTAADLERADLILVYYWFQFEALPHLQADFERHRGKLLIGVSSHLEIEGSRGEAGLAILSRLARGVFAVNRLLYQQCKSRLKLPVFYTPNGVDTEFFRPATDERAMNSLRVGWAGSLHNVGPEHRGYANLILPAVQAVEGAELVTAVREKQWRGPEEMREFYHSLNVYLCASRSEGTPNPCLEAAACGVPLLSTRVGNMAELIRHGSNGFLIEPELADITSKLRLLRDDPALRASLAQTIRSDVQFWDWSIQAQAYRQMFEDMLQQSRSVAFILSAQEVKMANQSSAAPDSEEESQQRIKAALGQKAKESLRLIPAEFFAAHHEVELTIVMLSYGRLEQTLSAVQALAENVRIPFKLLLIDNGSGAEVQSQLSKVSAKYDFIDLVLLPENLGCTGARVYALDYVKTPYLMFLDNDIEVFPGTVEHLLYSLESNPQVVAAAGNVIFPDGVIHVCGGDYWCEGEVLFSELLEGGKHFDDPSVGRSGSCRWVNAGLTMFRREVLSQYPFDAAIDSSKRGYFEDNEWCYRLNQLGVGSFYRSVEAVGLHYQQAAVAEGSVSIAEQRQRSFKYVEAIAYFYKVHGKILHSCFHLVPELGPTTNQVCISAAKILLALINSYGGEWVLDQWKRDGVAALFPTPQFATRMAEKEQAISSLSAQAAELEQTAAILSAQLHMITGSNAWKLVQALWWLRRKLAPRGKEQN